MNRFGMQLEFIVSMQAQRRIDDAVLALLLLVLLDGDRVWKSFDCYALDGLHEQGHISNPICGRWSPSGGRLSELEVRNRVFT